MGLEMTATRNPSTESERGADAPVQRPKAADGPMIWRESDFAPVKIRGEPLSHTVIEDRR